MIRCTSYTDLATWVELAKLLERGKFDALFLADVIGIYDTLVEVRQAALRQATQVPVNDPALLIPAMAYATEHLGFAFTSSVLQYHPFIFARLISTLDHLTKGRIAWNVVTTLSRQCRAKSRTGKAYSRTTSGMRWPMSIWKSAAICGKRVGKMAQ